MVFLHLYVNSKPEELRGHKVVAVMSHTISSCLDWSCWVYCLLDVCVRYVEGVLDGSVSPDNAVGRTLWDLVQSVPKVGTS